MNDMLSSALAYAERGWAVIPLHTPKGIGCSCNRSDCKSIGKHPRTKRGLKDASIDEITIRRWWGMWPDANIGIVTGAVSGIVGIDVDPRHGGEDTVRELGDRLPSNTPWVTTGSGGLHILYRHPGGHVPCDASGKLGPGIDVRGDGGYLVAAPSLHQSGMRYAWEQPYTTPLADLPSWIKPKLSGPKPRTAPSVVDTGEVVREGGRHHFLLRHAGRLRRQGLSPAAIEAALQVVNLERCDPPQTEAEVARIAHDIGAKPAGDPVLPPAPPPSAPPLQDDADPVAPIQYSDDAIAQLFSLQHQEDLRYVPEWGWLRWDGTRWARTPDVLVMDMARRICRLVATEAREDPEAGQESTRRKLAARISSAATAAAVERLARGAPEHLSDARIWDSDPYLLNTPGGAVELRTGRLRPHRREDYCTKITKATPRGRSERWERFLERVTTPEIAAYLKRLAGYALTGSTQEECFTYLYGQGGNGKGTFLNTLTSIMGDYAIVTSAETFLETRHDRHPTEIAKMQGARLVAAQEVDEGARWNEARLKELTGRDPITARFMRKDEFTFLPQLTLIFAGNHRPQLKSTDAAIRRRFHLVPFEQQIPESERDPRLKDNLLAEADAIMAWAVEGALDWQEVGLSPPDSIRSATESYLDSEDTFGLWLDECCIVGADHQEAGSLLYASFKRWKEARGEGVPSLTRFGRTLSDRGFDSKRASIGNMRMGLRLNDLETRKMQEVQEAQGGWAGGYS